MPGIDFISIIKPGKENILNIAVFYRNNEGKQKHFSLSMAEEGKLSAKLPAELKISNEQLYDEILDIINKVGMDFWYNEPQEILNVPDWPMPEKEKEGEPKRVIAEDPRRIEFLRKQPDVLFGFYGQEGFLGYRGFVFENFIALEHPKRENAAYFIDFREPISKEEAEKIKNSQNCQKKNTGKILEDV